MSWKRTMLKAAATAFAEAFAAEAGRLGAERLIGKSADDVVDDDEEEEEEPCQSKHEST